MVVHDRIEDGILFLRPVTDRLDATTANEFKSLLNDYVSRETKVIVLDLAEVEFMDSSGLGVLISGMRSLEGRGELALCGVREGVLGLLRLTGMDRVFAVFGSEREARASRLGRAI